MMADGKEVCKTVLIDLDGTLIDTAEDIVGAANQMLDDLSAMPLPIKTVSSFIGRGVRNLVRRSLEASGLDTTTSIDRAEAIFYRHYTELNGRFSRVYPGVLAGLIALRNHGLRLACVTNKPQALAAPLLSLTGLAPHFDALVGGDSLTQMKPDPEPLRHACRLLDSDVVRTVMVGDSAVDVAAARAAGMPVYLVRYGYAGPGGAHALSCDGLLDSLEDLPDFLTRGRLVPAA
jgi:phosphoglycolate phosphatase